MQSSDMTKHPVFIHKTNVKLVFLTVFVLALQVTTVTSGSNSISDEESCYSFGPDRHVYPQGSSTSDHKLQYTKAVSKCICASKHLAIP